MLLSESWLLLQSSKQKMSLVWRTVAYCNQFLLIFTALFKAGIGFRCSKLVLISLSHVRVWGTGDFGAVIWGPVTELWREKLNRFWKIGKPIRKLERRYLIFLVVDFWIFKSVLFWYSYESNIAKQNFYNFYILIGIKAAIECALIYFT